MVAASGWKRNRPEVEFVESGSVTGPSPDAEQLTSDVEWIATRLSSLALIHPNADRVEDEIVAIRATLRRLAAENQALRQRLSLRLAESKNTPDGVTP